MSIDEKLDTLEHDLNNTRTGVQELFEQLKDQDKRITAIEALLTEGEDQDRLELLDERIAVQSGHTDQRLDRLEARVMEIMKRETCSHEVFSLDGQTPFYIMAIADEREMKVLVPGQKPEPTFALGICSKCWQTFVAVNRLEEVEPVQPMPGPRLVEEGDEVVG